MIVGRVAKLGNASVLSTDALAACGFESRLGYFILCARINSGAILKKI